MFHYNNLAKKLIWIPIVGLLLFLLTTLAVPHSQAQETTNLLINGGFESPYAKQCCHTSPEFPPNTLIDEVQVAHGWSGWWVEPDSAPHLPSRCDIPNPPNPCYAFHRPEWREAAPYSNRIHSGGNAQKYFTFYSVHQSGMFQRVTGITPGQRLRFTIYMQGWATDSNDLTSSGQLSMNMKVGIDPTGGTNPFAATVVWGQTYDTYDVWGEYSVEAVAIGDAVTVFTHSYPVYPLQHNDIYLDDASLIVVAAAQPTAPPRTGTPRSTNTPTRVPTTTNTPTNTPTPTRTPTPTSTPTPSITPTPTIDPLATATPNAEGIIYETVDAGEVLWQIAARAGLTLDQLLELNDLTRDSLIQPGQVLILGYVSTATPVATIAPTETPAPPATETPEPTSTQPATITPEPTVATGTLCLKAFEDSNQNGLHDAGEGLRSDVAFTVSDGQQVIANYITTGAEPYCIEGLAPNNYQITRSQQEGEVLTTRGDWAVDLAAESVVTMEFGSYTEIPTEVAAAPDESLTPLATAEMLDNTPDTPSGNNTGNIITIAAIGGGALLLVIAVGLFISRRR